MRAAPRLAAWIGAAAFALATWWAPAFAQPAAPRARAPLTVADKPVLFQRVLTRAGATLAAKPGGPTTGQPLTMFTPLYVYQRQPGWLEVGASTGKADGWLADSAGLEWNTTIVATFANPANRGATLLFSSREEALRVSQLPTRAEAVTKLRADVAASRKPKGVVAREPDAFVDPTKNFYILPIFKAEEIDLPNAGGRATKLLEVATAALNAPKNQAPPDLTKYKVGVVFVVDTTISMDPYIARVRTAVQEATKKIAASPIGARARFGLVGFQASRKLTPGLDYVSKIHLPLRSTSDAAAFDRAISSLSTAKVSSAGFREDAYAGIHRAIYETNWEGFDGRFVILVTDAGPREPSQGFTEVKMAADALHQGAEDEGVAVFALHVKTPPGAADHAGAEASYRRLARQGAEQLYFSISGGELSAFGAAVDGLTKQIVEMVADAARGRLSSAAPNASPVQQAAARVGYAMQLRYLGVQTGAHPPDVFRAHVFDRDLTPNHTGALNVHVLLTRNQFATLRDSLKGIVRAANTTIDADGDGRSFFDSVRAELAAIATDPNRRIRTDVSRLDQTITDYLSGLPYRSAVMSMSAADWDMRSAVQRRELVHVLTQRIALIERTHDDLSKWTRPHPSAPDGDMLFAMPLGYLP